MTPSRSSVPAFEPPELGGDPRAGPALAAALGDRLLERPERPHDPLAIGGATEPLALGEELTQRAMAPLAVAAPTGRHLVLDPTRATLDAGHEMFRRRHHETVVEIPGAPHAGRTVTFEDDLHAPAPVGLPRRFGTGRQLTPACPRCHVVSPAHGDRSPPDRAGPIAPDDLEARRTTAPSERARDALPSCPGT